jgi:hypothetical protein
MLTCDPKYILEPISNYDNAVDESLQHNLGTPVFGQDRLLMHLPLSMGGLGIPIACLSSETAFLSSIGSSWNLRPNNLPRKGFIEIRNRLIADGFDIPMLQPKIHEGDATPLISQRKEFSQHKLMINENETFMNNLLTRASLRKKAIMLGRACKCRLLVNHTSKFKNSKSNSTFHFLSTFMRIALCFGKPVCPDCGKDQDNYGDHALSCKTSSGSIDRHNSIVYGIFMQLKKAAIIVSSEGTKRRQ